MDAILCVAGGWAGGNAASAGARARVYVSSCVFVCACVRVCLFVCVCVCVLFVRSSLPARFNNQNTATNQELVLPLLKLPPPL